MTNAKQNEHSAVKESDVSDALVLVRLILHIVEAVLQHFAGFFRILWDVQNTLGLFPAIVAFLVVALFAVHSSIDGIGSSARGVIDIALYSLNAGTKAWVGCRCLKRRAKKGWRDCVFGDIRE